MKKITFSIIFVFKTKIAKWLWNSAYRFWEYKDVYFLLLVG